MRSRLSIGTFADVRGRGLRPVPGLAVTGWLAFAPVRVRGLKPARLTLGLSGVIVRARTGAWIETHQWCFGQDIRSVRARTGAWIETTMGPPPGYPIAR